MKKKILLIALIAYASIITVVGGGFAILALNGHITLSQGTNSENPSLLTKK